MIALGRDSEPVAERPEGRSVDPMSLSARDRFGLNRFVGDERGAMLVFALMMFILMLAIGGLAVDVMRHEALRTKLQSTTDRAVLAAASLDQSADPEGVVDDYFAKAGMSDMLVSRTAVTGLGFREVDAQTAAIQDNLFMRMIGIDTLGVQAQGAAEESISKIEVSLVLDISSSMNSNNRLINLRPAAVDFVDMLIGDTTDGDISISVIPYSGQVNAGSALLSQYNVTSEHSDSNCVQFENDDFDTTALSQNDLLQREAHFDPWYTSKAPTLRFCLTEPTSEIIPVSNNGPALKARMQALQAAGNTSIDIGVKWGAALLDPGTRPVISTLSTAGIVPAALNDRPFDFNNPQVLKVLVVMSDGQNWDQFEIDPQYDSGDSPIYINTEDNNLSIWHESQGQYYIQHLNQWRDEPWGAPGTFTTCGWNWYGGSWHYDCTTTTTTVDTSARLTWPQVWKSYTVRWIADELYGDAFNSWSVRNAWINNFLNVTQPSIKDNRLSNVCNSLKTNNNTLIFAVGFEAPSSGRDALRDCASSPGHYYDADGIEIRDVFAAIARQISQLKLTQ